MTTQSPLVPYDVIEGVYTVPLRVFGDDRGSFAEVFRREWFPMVNWDEMQMNRSISKPGVLRGLHYHLNQIDYWLLLDGRIRVGLADLRESSPTYKTGATIDLDAAEPTGLFIPSGVAHGFYAQTDMTLMYVVNQYYKGGEDERGLAWDDPELGVAWDVSDPVLSQRDQENKPLSALVSEVLPG